MEMNWCNKCGRYMGESTECFCKKYLVAHVDIGYTHEDPKEVWGIDKESAAERYAFLYNEQSADYSMMSGDNGIEIEVSEKDGEQWTPAKVTAEAVIQYWVEIS